MRLALTLLCSGAVVAHSVAAWACGSTPEPSYAAAEQRPTGSGVPVNTPIVVELAESARTEDGPLLSPRLTLVVEGTDEALAVTSVGSAPRLVWVPREPLATNTSYEAHFNTGYEGHPDTIWHFTTGDEVTPPVALEGELQVTFEPAEEPVMECFANCGTACTQVGTVSVTKARVRLPRAILGFPKYHAEVWLTDNTPLDFASGAPDSGPSRGSHLVNLGTWVSYDERGEPVAEALFTVPEEEEPYRPCISMRVVDERGQSAESSPLCAERTFPFASKSTSAGCSFGVGKANTGVVVALLGLVALTRRRLPRSAP